MTQPQPSLADPLEMWRNWLTESERQWNAFLNKSMATDEFSQSMGRAMDVYLNLQKGMSEAMGRYLSALNLPSRADVLALGDRLAAIEDRLDSIERIISRPAPAERASAGALPAEAAKPSRPPRTKKPQKA